VNDEELIVERGASHALEGRQVRGRGLGSSQARIQNELPLRGPLDLISVEGPEGAVFVLQNSFELFQDD
jgi:hypothetical protein